MRGEVKAVAPDASGRGYWIVTQSGAVYAFGDAQYYGGPGQKPVPVTAAVRTPSGKGYWILFSDGVVFRYGDAVSYGSLPAGPPVATTSPPRSSHSTPEGAIGSPLPPVPSTPSARHLITAAWPVSTSTAPSSPQAGF